ncbi:hypothetical protein EXIGLDRAFT_411448 [Exidia glandulosa HHB12029]|uniref:Uncharacterized protein n=1 Tax=Exidia glandulosa HHB12029 TaxID=1314781 RepID=A0A165KPH4_EXIGL|nr:hypothetical protein EXIGLDRAFT_411448 [Exidia glandulosa HHB12029]
MQTCRTAVARRLQPHLLRCRAPAALRSNGRCAQQFAYATRAHTGARIPAPKYSVPLFARNAYLDGLREAAASARTPDDVEHVFRLVRAAPAAELEQEGLLTVITVLRGRKDPRLLRALIDSKLFRPWYGSRFMVASAYGPLFRALFNPHGSCPPPTDDELYGIIADLKSRGGVVTPTMSYELTRVFMAGGRSLPPIIEEAIKCVVELPVGIDFNRAKWELYIKVERRTRSWRDVLCTVLPHLQYRRMPTTTITALMHDDVWKPRDIDEITDALAIEVDTGIVSRAVEIAVKRSGARAGMEVFEYARSKGLYISHRSSQHLITALVAFRNSSITSPAAVDDAVNVFRRQVQPDNPATDSHHLGTLPLLSALAVSIGVKRRWEKISDIISFLRRKDASLMPHLRRKFSSLIEDIFLCPSHSAGVDILYGQRRDLAYDELLQLLHHIGKLRFDSAPTFSYADFVAFLRTVESCSHVLSPELIASWISAVSHSRVLLRMSWEQHALGPSAKGFDDLAVSYLHQLEKGLLADKPALDTLAVRVQLMTTYGVYSSVHDEDVLRCWTWIVDHNAVTDEIIPYALQAVTGVAAVRDLWNDVLHQGVVPSRSTWAEYAARLIRCGRPDEGFEILRNEVGDDSHYRRGPFPPFAPNRSRTLCETASQYLERPSHSHSTV